MVSTITLRQLQYFVAAADAGSMTAAGREQHVSQSTISLAIGDLERTVGTQLVIRHHARGLSLTPAGRHMATGARQLLRRTDELIGETQSLGEELSGTLAVACYDTIAPFLIPRVVTSFRQLHPDVDVELHGGDMADLGRKVKEGQCELFIAYDLDIAADLTTTLLEQTSPYVLLPADHELAASSSIVLDELVDEPLVLLDQPQPSSYILGMFRARQLQPRIAYRASSFELVRSLVARGLGYSLLIQRPMIDVSYEGIALECRPVTDPPHTLDLVAATPASVNPTRRATAFISHCRTSLANQPPP